MSLVIAFVGANGAAMAGDTRQIITRGERIPTELLEDALYHGRIVSDADLVKRAGDLGLEIVIRDDREKIRQQGGVLVGEVSESIGGVTRSRRLYATGGEYAIVELDGATVRVSGRGRGSRFVVLGNPHTSRIATSCIREEWKGGSMHDAIRVLALSLQRAAAATASVSGRFDLIQTDVCIPLPQFSGNEGT